MAMRQPVPTSMLSKRSKLDSRQTFLAFSLQSLPNLPNSSVREAFKGAYAPVEFEEPSLILTASGSEVGLCVDAAKEMEAAGTKEGHGTRKQLGWKHSEFEGTVSNVLALDTIGLIPSNAFTIFSDYIRSAIRAPALSQAGTIFLPTNVPIAVGEDGPTIKPRGRSHSCD
eukprot:TRINITY_DN9455_c0_g1_i1.p4 TRINITY_DN9455_c0_g1~~TRINITY_DN9455_c0_g1_i1.p4  ORF type:complete len:170 (+),score=33.42 TRINITY_DN9455_c0_g1_i1:233-742(+)